MPNVSFRIKRIKHIYNSKRWQSLLLQLRQRRSYLACAIVRLILMLARAIFRSWWRFCTCVDTRTSDCAYIRGMHCVRRCNTACREIQPWCRKTGTQSNSGVLKDVWTGYTKDICRKVIKFPRTTTTSDDRNASFSKKWGFDIPQSLLPHAPCIEKVLLNTDWTPCKPYQVLLVLKSKM